MESKINVIKADYAELVAQVKSLDAQLLVLAAREVAKKARAGRTQGAALRARAERLRHGPDVAPRVVPVGRHVHRPAGRDELLHRRRRAGQGARQPDRRRPGDARRRSTRRPRTPASRTNELRQETAAQKRALDASLLALKDAKAELKKLEKRTAATLAAQKRTYQRLARNKAAAAAIIREAAAKQKRLAKKINALIQKQVNRGNIPSQFNGTMRWPMDSFSVSGDYGCSSFEYYAPGNGCAHYHNGIDLVGPSNSRVKAAAAGTVVYVGWNWADGPDPAWIVVIAHSSNVKSWYAHMQPTRPVTVGEHVSKGEVIGIQGSTGHATGAHLHWMVELNGSFVNPRLFL